SHIRYALTHRPPIVFDSLVKQFWATAIMRTLEAGPSEIIAIIDGNEVVVTESLIRTQLQLNDANGLYEFTLHDVLDGMREIGTYNFFRFILDGMIWNIGSKRHKFFIYPRFLQMILGIQTTYPSPRPTFDFTTKLFSNIKWNWDGPHMPLLAPMLVVPAGGDGADAAAANKVSSPPPPPHVPPTHTSSSTPGPSPAAQDTPVREPTPSPVREPTTFQEPTPDSPRPPSPPPYPRSEEVGPTTSTRPPSPTRQTSFQEDISEGVGDYVSSPKSNEAPPTTAETTAGGAEDSDALTVLSIKLDRCINRVTTLENELGVTKKVLGGAVLKLVSKVKRLKGLLQQRKRRLVLSDSEGDEAATKEQDIDLDALHKLASTSLGGDTTVEAAYTIYKASQAAHASSDAGHDEDEVSDDATMPFRHTRTNTPIPSSGGVSAGSYMDLAGQAAAAAPSSTIPAADKGKAPMVDDSLPTDILTEKQSIGLSAQRRRELDASQLIYTEADWLELMAKIATNSALSMQLLGDDVNEDNMNERLGMLLMRKLRELAEQSRVKALSIAQLKHEFDYIQWTLERSNLLNFKRTSFRPTPTLEAPSAKRDRQGVPDPYICH
nr:hypothetical protein [Tanacetum cinerariifolium]